MGCDVVTVSTDTQFSHLAWQRSEKELANVKYQMGADPTGKVSRMFGVYDEALKSYENATALRPEVPAGHFNLANILRDLGQIEDARASCDGKPPETGSFDLAIAAYDKAIAEMPAGDRRLIGLYYARGVALERSNRWGDAERDFRAALKMNPERADVLNYLGYTWVDKGEHLDEAVGMLEKARALRPLDWLPVGAGPGRAVRPGRLRRG
jgi:tetratricopeptide (TPR) repeat protein